VGGPLVIPKIVKDTATFFYLNYTGTRSRQPYSAVETVPTALERGGDFSQAAAIRPERRCRSSSQAPIRRSPAT
jgi:hypothetical protein